MSDSTGRYQSITQYDTVIFVINMQINRPSEKQEVWQALSEVMRTILVEIFARESTAADYYLVMEGRHHVNKIYGLGENCNMNNVDAMNALIDEAMQTENPIVHDIFVRLGLHEETFGEKLDDLLEYVGGAVDENGVGVGNVGINHFQIIPHPSMHSHRGKRSTMAACKDTLRVQDPSCSEINLSKLKY